MPHMRYRASCRRLNLYVRCAGSLLRPALAATPASRGYAGRAAATADGFVPPSYASRAGLHTCSAN
jgi:hypothetical protein